MKVAMPVALLIGIAHGTSGSTAPTCSFGSRVFASFAFDFGFAQFKLSSLGQCQQECCATNGRCQAVSYSATSSFWHNCHLYDNKNPTGGLFLDYYLYFKESSPPPLPPMLTINEVGGDSDDMSVAIIAGASVGGVIALIIIILVIWHCTRASGKSVNK